MPNGAGFLWNLGDSEFPGVESSEFRRDYMAIEFHLWLAVCCTQLPFSFEHCRTNALSVLDSSSISLRRIILPCNLFRLKLPVVKYLTLNTRSNELERKIIRMITKLSILARIFKSITKLLTSKRSFHCNIALEASEGLRRTACSRRSSKSP